MQDKKRIFGRLGQWFRRRHVGQMLTGAEHDERIHSPGDPSAIESAHATRSTFLRPWARNEQSIGKLQEGFDAITGLMGSVRDHLEKQSARQDELLGYLSRLPEAIDSIPQANRAHGETLQAIHQQLVRQNDGHGRLVEVLEKIGQAGGETKAAIDEIRDGVESLGQHEQRISDTLGGVGEAMRDVSDNSQSTTKVLQSLRDNFQHRDAELSRILHRQNTRFTTLLSVAIVLATAALAAVAIMGYLMLSGRKG